MAVKLQKKVALKNAEEEKMRIEEQIDLIKNSDFETMIPTADTWWALAETSVRGENIFPTLLRNLFPNATGVEEKHNGVYFKMYGFSCYVPTYDFRCVFVMMDWYHKKTCLDMLYPSGNARYLKMYREAVANGYDNVRKCIIINRMDVNKKRSTLERFKLWIKWHMQDKYKLPSVIKKWEEEDSRQRAVIENESRKVRENNQEIHNKVIRLCEELIPELETFAEVNFDWNTTCCVGKKTLLEIKREEGIK